MFSCSLLSKRTSLSAYRLGLYAGLKFSKNFSKPLSLLSISLVVWDCKNTSKIFTCKHFLKKKSKKILINWMSMKYFSKKNRGLMMVWKTDPQSLLLYIIGVKMNRSICRFWNWMPRAIKKIAKTRRNPKIGEGKLKPVLSRLSDPVLGWI